MLIGHVARLPADRGGAITIYGLKGITALPRQDFPRGLRRASSRSDGRPPAVWSNSRTIPTIGVVRRNERGREIQSTLGKSPAIALII
jgi:hypothetical protein